MALRSIARADGIPSSNAVAVGVRVPIGSSVLVNLAVTIVVDFVAKLRAPFAACRVVRPAIDAVRSAVLVSVFVDHPAVTVEVDRMHTWVFHGVGVERVIPVVTVGAVAHEPILKLALRHSLGIGVAVVIVVGIRPREERLGIRRSVALQRVHRRAPKSPRIARATCIVGSPGECSGATASVERDIQSANGDVVLADPLA